MINRTFNPQLAHRFVIYRRYSDPDQNPRSVQQQHNTVIETLERLRYPWIFVKHYEDTGITGRVVGRRPGFQCMLREIEVGIVKVDLILVDMKERFGRADAIPEVFRRLREERGVLVLAANTNFADPTGAAGAFMGAAEQIRTVEDGKVKAHNVLRGKKDVARQMEWPGAPPPLGYQIHRESVSGRGKKTTRSTLVIEPTTAGFMRLLFERADATGHGSLRLSKWWNSNPAIPDALKPISDPTIRHRLSNPIYIGTLHYARVATDIVNDTWVREKNEQWEIIENFCEPIVDRELFERVNSVMRSRGEAIARAREAKSNAAASAPDEKQIAPMVRGLALVYALAGLVRCGECNASMRAVPSGRTSRAGKRYIYFVCGRNQNGACANTRYVPVDRLQSAVFSKVRAKLLPADGASTPLWYGDVHAMVQREFNRLRDAQPTLLKARKSERDELQQRMHGWMQSLGNPRLALALRTGLEAQYDEAQTKVAALDASIAEEQAIQAISGSIVKPEAIIESLQRFDELLAGENPTRLSLELSKHIEQIRVWPNGRIEMIGSYLGIFEGAVELLSRVENKQLRTLRAPSQGYNPVNPRLRGALRLPTLSAESAADLKSRPTNLDPERFSCLPEHFKWTEALAVEGSLCWSELHAAECAKLRKEGKTHEWLAAHFGKTVPTIRKALKLAAKDDPELSALPRKMARPRWPEQHFEEVAALRAQGMRLALICQHFGKSEPLIREALRLAAQKDVLSATDTAGSSECSDDPFPSLSEANEAKGPHEPEMPE